MNSELQAIKDAWDTETGNGRDPNARTLADQYVKNHPDQFEDYKELTLPECVKALEVFRDAGMESEQWKVETWLLHRYEPQNIGGTYQAQVRLTQEETTNG